MVMQRSGVKKSRMVCSAISRLWHTIVTNGQTDKQKFDSVYRGKNKRKERRMSLIDSLTILVATTVRHTPLARHSWAILNEKELDLSTT